MKNHVEENKRINEALKQLYAENKKEFLEVWGKHFGVKENDRPCRINEFGIIDPERFDTEKRVLVICKETNGWSNAAYADKNEDLFIDWMKKITQKEKNCLEGQNGKIKKNPNTWYNIGRWVMSINDESEDRTETILTAKDEAFHAIGTIAFTNINKVRGESSSGKSYRDLSKEPLVMDMIIKEIETIKPNHIILCDKTFLDYLIVEYEKNKEKHTSLKKCIENKTLYVMPHPAARMKKVKMLQELKKQLKK